MDKGKIISGFVWTAIETYSSQGIAFLVSLVMARILTPGDYGIIGIIGVFLAISDVLVYSGFTEALINKKVCSNSDYCTAFIVNTSISGLLFIALWVASPFIANFYNNHDLVWTTRAMAILIVISGIGAVPMTILTKRLDFKHKAVITLAGAACSGIIGISLALNGWGVWALVWQSIVAGILRIILLEMYVKWLPTGGFSTTSFNCLFGFGSKLLMSNIIFTLFNNIYSLVIGKAFSTTQLGYFSRADGYSKLIPTNISGILSKILFPILSKEKDDNAQLILLHKQFIIVTSYFIFPCCLFFAGLAAPMVHLLITDKWMPIVPILQILCIAGIFEHFASINSNFVLAKGYSSFFLRMQMITKPLGIVILIITLWFNLKIIAIGKVVYSCICFITGYVYLKRVLPISFIASLKEVFSIFMISTLITGLFIFVFRHLTYDWINLIIVGTGGVLTYALTTWIFCPITIYYIKRITVLRKGRLK